MPPYSGFKPLVGGGAQRATLPTGPSASTRGGLSATASLAADAAGPEPKRDAALRATFVDREEAAMMRAMAKLNGDDQKSRDLGNKFSTKNRVKQAATAREAAALGLTPLDPLEQHELSRKMAAAERVAGHTKTSERAVAVPRVGMPGRPHYPAVAFIPRRKGEEEIRQEFGNFEVPQAPPGVPVRSSDDKRAELAERNQFNGKTAAEVLASAPPKPPPAASLASAPQGLRAQIEDEVAERQEFLDQMRALGRGKEHEAVIQGQIAERMDDLRRLDKVGGDGL